MSYRAVLTDHIYHIYRWLNLFIKKRSVFLFTEVAPFI